jgi:hypothetical protein
MKKLIYILFLILFASAFIISCSDDDDDSTTGPDSNDGLDQSLVGTWVLTKILSPIAASPEDVGIALTVVFNDDGSMELTSEDAESTATYPGTWSTKNGELTITLEESEPGTSPYSINGNIATISQFPVEFQGNTILASLEFTKSP